MDGQIRFQARMRYGREAVMALQQAAGRTTRRRYVRLCRGFDFVFGALMLGDGVMMLWTGDRSVWMWLMLILGALLLSFGAFYYQLSALRVYLRMPKGEAGLERLVSFSDVRARCAAGQSETGFEYGAFQRLCQWKDFLILFVDAAHALLVDERAVTLGTPQELRAFLEEKTGKKVETLH